MENLNLKSLEREIDEHIEFFQQCCSDFMIEIGDPESFKRAKEEEKEKPDCNIK